MAFDGLAEQEALLAYLRENLFGGRVHDSLPDDAILERDEQQNVRPYAVVWFGELYDSAADRSIAGEEQQPVIMPVTVECWAADSATVRRCAAAVRVALRGWRANDNMTELRLRGGGSFNSTDATGRPSRFMRAVNGEALLNMSVTV